MDSPEDQSFESWGDPTLIVHELLGMNNSSAFKKCFTNKIMPLCCCDHIVYLSSLQVQVPFFIYCGQFYCRWHSTSGFRSRIEWNHCRVPPLFTIRANGGRLYDRKWGLWLVDMIVMPNKYYRLESTLQHDLIICCHKERRKSNYVPRRYCSQLSKRELQG